MGGSSILAVALAAVIVSFSITGTQSTTFNFKNNCQYTVWPGAQKNSDSPELGTTGFVLPPGATNSVNAPAGWAGRFWARTHCTSSSTGQLTCVVGDCGPAVACNGAGGNPPVSLAEFKLNGFSGLDNYDISLVDGSNIQLSIQPQDTPNCKTVSCLADINKDCPANLVVTNGGDRVACNSACNANHSDEDCCTGAHNTAATCQPSASSKFFKQECPDAYSYAFDDRSSLPTCPTGPNYLITFCP